MRERIWKHFFFAFLVCVWFVFVRSKALLPVVKDRFRKCVHVHIVVVLLLFLTDGAAVARVLDLQVDAAGARGVAHGARVGVGVVVGRAHGLHALRVAANVVALRAVRPSLCRVPEALLARSAQDVITGLGLGAASLVGDADGLSEQARGTAQVAHAGVGDTVLAAHVLLLLLLLALAGFRGARAQVAEHAVRVVVLVQHAEGAAGTLHVLAVLLAWPMVLHLQVGLALAPGLEERAAVAVRLAVRAAHGRPARVGAVGGADATRLVPAAHAALLARPAVHVVARLFAGLAVGRPAAEGHPAEQRGGGHLLARVRRAQTATPAALVLAHVHLEQLAAAAVLALLQPAVAGVRWVIRNECKHEECAQEDFDGRHLLR